MTPPPQPPLTHHEILRWVGPFTRRGRHVDLPASDRLARQLVFKPLKHVLDAASVAVDVDAGHVADPLAHAVAGPAAMTHEVTESLQLDSLGPEHFRLTRRLTRDDGLVAQLVAEGAAPGDLLACIEAVPVGRQFADGPGHAVAFSHRWLAGALPTTGAAVRAAVAGAPDAELALVLTEARLRIDGLVGTLVVPPVSGSGELTLECPAGLALALPDDLLAVLGRAWTPLRPREQAWRGGLRLRGGELRRSRTAEAEWQRAAAHLARCLAEPPARFHQRLMWARRAVAARRCTPLVVSAALVAAAASVHRLELSEHSAWRMLIFNAPPLMLILFFCLRELPRFEIPPWPRAATAASWRPAPVPAAAEPARPA